MMMMYKFLLEQFLYDAMAYYAPTFEIEIEKNKMESAMVKSVIEVTVEEKIDEGASFSLVLNDELDLEKQEFKFLDHDSLNVGNAVTIKMGYVGNPLKLPVPEVVGGLLNDLLNKDKLETMFMGAITALEPEFYVGEVPTLTVRGQDLSYDYVKRRSPEKTFVNRSYSDIVRTVAQDAGLSVKVDRLEKYSTSVRKKSDESYFAFLERLAREVGFQFRIDRQTLYFKKPADTEKEDITLELGKDIISFCPTMNSAGLYAEVEVRGHNPADPGKPLVGRARAGSERAQERGRQTAAQVAKKCHKAPRKVITNMVVRSVAHADAVAAAFLNKASDDFIRGEVECIGRPEIKPGVCIKLDKLGKRFSGKYYVTGTRHSIGNNGYRTHLTVKRNAI